MLHFGSFIRMLPDPDPAKPDPDPVATGSAGSGNKQVLSHFLSYKTGSGNIRNWIRFRDFWDLIGVC